MPLAEVREEQTETIQQRFRSLQTTRDVASLLDVFTWSPCVQDPNNPTDKEVLRVEKLRRCGECPVQVLGNSSNLTGHDPQASVR